MSGRDAHKKLKPGEPHFTLRGQDMLAPGIVLEWAKRAEAMGVDAGMIKEARAVAEAMQRWPKQKRPD
jgi:hypothetical protein